MGRSLELEFKTSLGNMVKTPSLQKIQKLAGVVTHPYNPSYSGAEIGEVLEPGRQRLQ